MSIAPMVIDFDEPTAGVKNAFAQFAPDGFGSHVWDVHNKGGKSPRPQVWKGMPILNIVNDASLIFDGAGNFLGSNHAADLLSGAISCRGSKEPGFYLFRIAWLNPANIMETLKTLKKKRPDLHIELLDPRSFFALYKKSLPPPPTESSQ